MLQAIHFVPDPEIQAVTPKIQQTLSALADSFDPETIATFLDEVLRFELEEAFHSIEATEGTLWIRDRAEKNLIPIYNNGKSADKFVLKHKQPLDQGIISMVYATEMPFAESEVYKNQKHDKTLDQKLGVLTTAMVAVPVTCLDHVRGIISAVKLISPSAGEAEPPPFSPEDGHRMQIMAETLRRSLDLKIYELTLGLKNS